MDASSLTLKGDLFLCLKVLISYLSSITLLKVGVLFDLKSLENSAYFFVGSFFFPLEANPIDSKNYSLLSLL